MAAVTFSSFHKTQIVFELRFDEAYALWDKTGLVWNLVGRHFKAFKAANITPNEQTFYGDDRFTMVISLQRAFITDHKPQPTIESTMKVFSAFMDIALENLDIKVLNRVGNRYQYSLDFKSLEEARHRARAAIPNSLPRKTLFSLEPSSVAPTFKIEGDDGEFAYNAQLYAREQTIDFAPPPDASVVGIEKAKKSLYQLVLDIDFYTKKSIGVESFQVGSWLEGWNKTMTRDADAFLSLAEGKT